MKNSNDFLTDVVENLDTSMELSGDPFDDEDLDEESADALIDEIAGEPVEIDQDYGELVDSDDDYYDDDDDGMEEGGLFDFLKGRMKKKARRRRKRKVGRPYPARSIVAASRGVFGPSTNSTAALAKVAQANKLANMASGKVDRDAVMKFIDIKGGTIKVAPIDPQSTFPVIKREHLIMQAQLREPYYTFVETQEPTAGSLTFEIDDSKLQYAGTYIPYFILQIGGPVLTTVPETIIDVDIDYKTAVGTTINNSQIIFAISGSKFAATMVIQPWKIVLAKPRATMIGVTAATGPADFKIAIGGLPANAKVSLIIPGVDNKSVKSLLGMVK